METIPHQQDVLSQRWVQLNAELTQLEAELENLRQRTGIEDEHAREQLRKEGPDSIHGKIASKEAEIAKITAQASGLIAADPNSMHDNYRIKIVQ